MQSNKFFEVLAGYKIIIYNLIYYTVHLNLEKTTIFAPVPQGEGIGLKIIKIWSRKNAMHKNV